MIGRILWVGAVSTVLVGAAGAQTFVDYDNQLGGTAAPVLGSRYWHSDVHTTAAGQNKNVGRWNDPTQVNSGTAPNISRVAATAPAGLAQGNAYELRWSFIGTLAGGTGNRSANEGDTFVRVFSAGPGMLNPVLDTSLLLQFDVWTAQPVRVAAIVSDAAQSAAVGSPGAGTSLEVLGGSGDDALEATGQGFGGYVLTAGQWQTVTVDFSDITVRTLSGNGVFSPATANRGALNGLGFTPVDGEGGLQVQHEVYLDNFRLSAAPVPEPATMLVLAAGVAAIGARRRRTR